MIIWTYGNIAGSAWDKRIWTYNYQPVFYFFKKDFKIDLQQKRYSAKSKGTDIWQFTGCQSNFNNPDIKKIHPSQKPVDLLKHAIYYTSNENDVVLDSFMGSGTCGVACRALNRKFIGIEIDRKYFDIAKRRILNTTKPIL